jgi:hypothetical protein
MLRILHRATTPSPDRHGGHALGHGWDPHHVGGTFVLTERAHAGAFELNGFLRNSSSPLDSIEQSME